MGGITACSGSSTFNPEPYTRILLVRMPDPSEAVHSCMNKNVAIPQNSSRTEEQLTAGHNINLAGPIRLRTASVLAKNDKSKKQYTPNYNLQQGNLQHELL